MRTSGGGGQNRQDGHNQQHRAEQEAAEGHEGREAGRAVGDVSGLGEHQEDVGGGDGGGAGDFEQAAAAAGRLSRGSDGEGWL